MVLPWFAVFMLCPDLFAELYVLDHLPNYMYCQRNPNLYKILDFEMFVQIYDVLYVFHATKLHLQRVLRVFTEAIRKSSPTSPRPLDFCNIRFLQRLNCGTVE